MLSSAISITYRITRIFCSIYLKFDGLNINRWPNIAIFVTHTHWFLFFSKELWQIFHVIVVNYDWYLNCPGILFVQKHGQNNYVRPSWYVNFVTGLSMLGKITIFVTKSTLKCNKNFKYFQIFLIIGCNFNVKLLHN